GRRTSVDAERDVDNERLAVVPLVREPAMMSTRGQTTQLYTVGHATTLVPAPSMWLPPGRWSSPRSSARLLVFLAQTRGDMHGVERGRDRVHPDTPGPIQRRRYRQRVGGRVAPRRRAPFARARVRQQDAEEGLS